MPDRSPAAAPALPDLDAFLRYVDIANDRWCRIDDPSEGGTAKWHLMELAEIEPEAIPRCQRLAVALEVIGENSEAVALFMDFLGNAACGNVETAARLWDAFGAAKRRLAIRLKARFQSPAKQAATSKTKRSGVTRGKSKEDVDAAMRRAIESDSPDVEKRLIWSDRQWAKYCHCSHNTVRKTPTFIELEQSRNRSKDEGKERLRANDKWRRR